MFHFQESFPLLSLKNAGPIVSLDDDGRQAHGMEFDLGAVLSECRLDDSSCLMLTSNLQSCPVPSVCCLETDHSISHSLVLLHLLLGCHSGSITLLNSDDGGLQGEILSVFTVGSVGSLYNSSCMVLSFVSLPGLHTTEGRLQCSGSHSDSLIMSHFDASQFLSSKPLLNCTSCPALPPKGRLLLMPFEVGLNDSCRSVHIVELTSHKMTS